MVGNFDLITSQNYLRISHNKVKEMYTPTSSRNNLRIQDNNDRLGIFWKFWQRVFRSERSTTSNRQQQRNQRQNYYSYSTLNLNSSSAARSYYPIHTTSNNSYSYNYHNNTLFNRPSPEIATKWSNSFQDLLACQSGVKYFTEYLASECNDEYLHFWNVCEEYRQLKSKADVRQTSQKIYNMFILRRLTEQQIFEIDIREDIRENITFPTINSFVEVQDMVWHFLHCIAYQEFLYSEFYTDLL